MAICLWNRFHRKDVLFQTFSDLMRHNADNRFQQNNRSNCFVHNCSVNFATLPSASVFSCRNINRKFVLNHTTQPLINDFVSGKRSLSSNNAIDTSDNSANSELVKYKNISLTNKRHISKILGLKLSFLQELDLFVTKDSNHIVFNYAFLDDFEVQKCHQIKYLLNYYRSKKIVKGDTFKEVARQWSAKRPDFLFLSFDSNFLNDLTSEYANKEFPELEPSSITIFDDPFNALTFYQQTKLPTVVFKFPNRKESINLKEFCSKINRRYNKIYFWSDDVDFCQKFRKNCSEHFDRSKLFRITCVENALQMLNQNNKEKFESIFESASHVDRPRILHVSETLDELFHHMNDSEIQGVQWTRFIKLNEHLRGHRPGELTIITGPTGSGKTTFVSEYSLDLCEQGVPTIWGSFEIQYHNLERKMLPQFIRRNFDHTNREQFEKASEKFAKLPLYFMNFHGQTDFEEVLKEARHTVLMRGVQHLIIDNLQFMLGLTADSNVERFHNQDFVIGAIREFATRYKCHVTLVAHPRKEKEETTLSNNSLYGGIKASQEADNIMIIMNKYHPRFKCNKYVQISKNRAYGSLGIVPLYYDKNTFCYSNLKSDDPLLNDQLTVDDSKSSTSILPHFQNQFPLVENDLINVKLDNTESGTNEHFQANFDDSKQEIHYGNFKAFLEEQKKQSNI